MIVLINFDEISPVWSNYLWINRTSPIEPLSAMCYLQGYDHINMTFRPVFFGYKVGDELAGVNSGHRCSDNSYRSRGLFVFPKFRGRGIAKKLLTACINQARNENATFIWSYPRKESANVYESAGFKITSNWELSELGYNAYCRQDL